MKSTKAIQLTSVVTQASGNSVSDMDGEKVMMSIRSGKYYNLGGIGGIIWDLMKQPITVLALIETLLSQYEVERSVCEVQVISFLIRLLNDELILITE